MLKSETLYQEELYNDYDDACIIVDLQKVKDNYKFFRAYSNKECAGVVKANAYGAGMIPVTKALTEVDCNKFFVSNIDEGIELRKNFSDITIYILHGMQQGQEEVCAYYNLIPVLNDIYQIEIWNNYAQRLKKKMKACLHIDTGMSRLGIDSNAIAKLALQNSLYNMLDIDYIISHLASAEETNNSFNEEQLNKFNLLASAFPEAKRSFSNSAGIFLQSKYHFDLIRIGKGLYGPNSFYALTHTNIKQAVSVYSRILQIRHIEEDTPVGYNSIYIAPKESVLAVLSLGYADGYLRSLSNRGITYIDGLPARVVGKVSMDLMVIDVTNIPKEKLFIGKKVEILGENAKFNNISEQAGTSSYEILTRLGGGRRLKRYYVG
jgi:alanine racemase